jgi:hypothetical protein
MSRRQTSLVTSNESYRVNRVSNKQEMFVMQGLTQNRAGGFNWLWGWFGSPETETDRKKAQELADTAYFDLYNYHWLPAVSARSNKFWHYARHMNLRGLPMSQARLEELAGPYRVKDTLLQLKADADSGQLNSAEVSAEIDTLQKLVHAWQTLSRRRSAPGKLFQQTNLPMSKPTHRLDNMRQRRRSRKFIKLSNSKSSSSRR